MKNGFVVTSLVLVAGYPTALAAEVLGVLPSTVSTLLSFPQFAGWFGAAGILALALRDYGRQPTYDAPPKSKPAPQPDKSAEPAATRDAGWVHQTISA